jgi:hypothetical protein
MARPKGTPNKVSGQVKRNVIAVFERLGGVDKMAAWADQNLSEFYKLYAKLLPSEINMSMEVSEQDQVDALGNDEFRAFAQACREISERNREAAEKGTTIN